MTQTLELVGSVRGQLEKGDYTVAMRTVSMATRCVCILIPADKFKFTMMMLTPLQLELSLTMTILGRDLKYAGHVKPLFSGKAEFAILFLECCKILVQVCYIYIECYQLDLDFI